MFTTLLALSLALGLTGRVAASPAPAPAPAATAPPKGSLPVGSTWEYAIGYTLKANSINSSVYFFDADMENTAASDIQTIGNSGHFMTCYFSAGTWESFRNDTGNIPASAIGNPVDGYDKTERWFDTRNQQVRDLMAQRIQKAAQKGCQGVEGDNVDGYDNDTGFDLTEADSINFINYLSKTARSYGMKYGCKNSPDIVPNVVSACDFVVVEQCVRYRECDSYKPFIDATKPVYHVEYTNSSKATTESPQDYAWNCAAGGIKGISTIFKHLLVDSWRLSCQ